MRPIWYADNRDLVKWGLLVHLARANSLKTIVQVPYRRPEKSRVHFTFQNQQVPIPKRVWYFFRDLKQIERLGDQYGLEIKVILDEFKPSDRKHYSAKIVQQLKCCPHPLILFLDPDTGLEPKNLKATHTSEGEVQRRLVGALSSRLASLLPTCTSREGMDRVCL